MASGNNPPPEPHFLLPFASPGSRRSTPNSCIHRSCPLGNNLPAKMADWRWHDLCQACSLPMPRFHLLRHGRHEKGKSVRAGRPEIWDGSSRDPEVRPEVRVMCKGPLSPDTASLQGDLFSLQGDLPSLQGDLSSLRGDLSSQQGDLSSLQGDLASLQGDLLRWRSSE